MAKYLTLWRKNPSAPWPTDPPEILKFNEMMWGMFDAMTSGEGDVKDYGYFLDGNSGYTIAEGDAKESLRAAAAFSPFFEFEVIEEVVSREVAQEIFTEDLKNKIAFTEAMKG